jgi:hypothetical protein
MVKTLLLQPIHDYPLSAAGLKTLMASVLNI